ncbi:MAG: phosphate ABC transporter permease subunit PstC [Candidatus Marinimicrobia bacterium]|nr:phosphate ABC transporter permease subunit PstC [Candidatus Neomarinimicrobiota bacterium]MCF7828150.1 phosphate ABC transporter permease subunit PstC [Candidatus Neomarinimicrobiota bacterium]MCF7879675.1 phosphate ABC transporter permease subunit PstC [Candidatus Neomarinimicrobiota bacterium]
MSSTQKYRGFRLPRKQYITERIIRGLLFGSGILSIFVTISIVVILVLESSKFFGYEDVSLIKFLTDTQWTPLFADKHFGIMPLLVGTLMVAFIALLVALPLGLLSAIYLSEYAKRNVRSFLKPLLEILAGIPTVVYGYFALVTVTPFLQKLIPGLGVFNALSAGMVMGIMILPMVSSLSEDAIRVVPQSLRNASTALGATKFETTTKVVVPASLSGIVSAFILAASRAIGETMIVAIAAGMNPTLTFSPFNSVETMTAYIVQVSLGDTPVGTLEYQSLFAVGMALFVMTLFFNLISHLVVKRYREVYQ